MTIPVGQSAANFEVTGVDDSDLDGTHSVLITASATGFANSSDAVSVTDDEVPERLPFAEQFDFGTFSSPLESGHTRVTGSTLYNASRGHGWTTPANELDRGAGSNTTRDLHYRAVGTFNIDVPNGTYGVMLTVGDEGPYAHDQVVDLEGASVDVIATAAREVLTRMYAVDVQDGQLNVRLDGRGGVDPNMVISGIKVVEIPVDAGAAESISHATLDSLFTALGNAH